MGSGQSPIPLAPARHIAMLPVMADPHRILAIDLARTAALAGMALFHFVFDLELFGHLPPGALAMPGPWAIFARGVAASFLFLAGVSLVLAHGRGIRWPAFLSRLAVLAAAALAITLVTWLAMPGEFIFFGILHAIALFSVIGLLFLRLPPIVTLSIAAGVFALPFLWTSPAFDTPWLLWLGLSPSLPRAMDFEPLFPWLAPFLLGMAAARIAGSAGLLTPPRDPPAPMLRRLAWPGRHSLAVYLLHQPVLLGSVWLATRLTG